MPDIRELKPRITVFGVGGAGGNAVNNMITAGLVGCDFVVANTDAQALTLSKAERIIQMGIQVTEGLGAGSQPDVGRAAAEEVIDEIRDHLPGAHMVFVTAGMGGGTGTGAAPIVAQAAKELGILTVGVVTKPFHFEGVRRMRVAEDGIIELQKAVDTLLIIPNQNLFRVANEKTTFADAFAMADQVLYSGVACITDLMVKEGLINLDFADVRAVMREMGKAMMGTGEASGDKRALSAAEAAISNPLIDETSMKGAKGLLISITGGKDLTLYEVDEAATRIREEVDSDANIIVGATFDESLDGIVRVSVVATGIDVAMSARPAGPRAPDQHAGRRRADAGTAGGRGGLAARRADAEPARLHAAHAPSRRTAPWRRRSRWRRRRNRPSRRRPQSSRRSKCRRRRTRRSPRSRTSRSGRSRRSRRCSSSAVEDRGRSRRRPAAPEKPFIPPQAERPALRAPRMPRIDELPIPAQNQIRARQAEAGRVPRRSRASRLLQRLASVGLGRREEEAQSGHRASAGAAERVAPPMPKAPPMPPLPRRTSLAARTRSRNTPSARSPSVPRRRASTSTAGRRL